MVLFKHTTCKNLPHCLNNPWKEFRKNKFLNEISYLKLTDLSIADRYSTGSTISKTKLTDSFIATSLISKKDLDNRSNTETKKNDKYEPKIVIEKLVDVPSVDVLKKKEEKEIKKEKVSLKEIDDRLLTIEDFLNSD